MNDGEVYAEKDIVELMEGEMEKDMDETDMGIVRAYSAFCVESVLGIIWS